MMKNLILGVAAAAFLIGGSAAAKEAKGKAKHTKAGKIEDCDEKAKSAIEAIEKATADLKASSFSGKAGGNFGHAQNSLKSALASVKKGCSAGAAGAAAAAPVATEEKKKE